MLVGASVADVITGITRACTYIHTRTRDTLVYTALKLWVLKATARPVHSTEPWRIEPRFRFQRTNGGFYIIKAILSDSDGDNIYDITSIYQFFLALHWDSNDTATFNAFMRGCIDRGIVPANIRERLHIKYLTNSGVYNVNYDTVNNTNTTMDDDLVFGDMCIDTLLSEKIN